MDNSYGSAISAGSANIDHRFGTTSGYLSGVRGGGDVQGPVAHMGDNVIRAAGRIEGQIGQINESIAVAHKLLHVLTNQLQPVLGRDPRQDESKAEKISAPVDVSQCPLEVQLMVVKGHISSLVQAIGSLSSALRI